MTRESLPYCNFRMLPSSSRKKVPAINTHDLPLLSAKFKVTVVMEMKVFKSKSKSTAIKC